MDLSLGNEKEPVETRWGDPQKPTLPWGTSVSMNKPWNRPTIIPPPPPKPPVQTFISSPGQGNVEDALATAYKNYMATNPMVSTKPKPNLPQGEYSDASTAYGTLPGETGYIPPQPLQSTSTFVPEVAQTQPPVDARNIQNIQTPTSAPEVAQIRPPVDSSNGVTQNIQTPSETAGAALNDAYTGAISSAQQTPSRNMNAMGIPTRIKQNTSPNGSIPLNNPTFRRVV